MTESFTIYKITILYMLDQVDFPLSNTQFSDFFLYQDYTDYFSVQEVLNDLVDAQMLRTRSTHSNTQYILTDIGKETLHMLKDRITPGIADDVADFFDKNMLTMKSENSVIADYFRTSKGNYMVRCQVYEERTPLVDLALHVPTRDQAESICAHWRKQNEDVYAYLMDLLL